MARDWTTHLPPYTPDGTCPKCSSETVGTRYCVAARPEAPGIACSPIGYFKAEHFDRWCERCGYAWAEQVMAC